MRLTWNTITGHPIVIYSVYFYSVYFTRNIIFQFTVSVARKSAIIAFGLASTICKFQLGTVSGHVFT